tara:strand:- start:335 stop:1216 length:882 start_codon:yes stop_codon:yes gene_type:complete
MEDKVLVSVIIPFYSKSTSRLKNCVLSALSQSITSIEVIVIDDCSPIMASMELDSILDDRLKIYRLSKNVKGAAARNQGLKIAKGHYIAFLDSDDVWLQNKLEKCLSYHQNPRDVVYSAVTFQVVGESKGDIRPKQKKEQSCSVSDYLFCKNGLIQTSSIFMERQLANKCRFNESYVRHQDYDLCFKLEKYGARFVFVEEALVTWFHEKGVSTISKGATLSFIDRWLEENRSYFSKSAYSEYLYKIYIPTVLESKMYSKFPIMVIMSNFSWVRLNVLKKWLKSLIKPFVIRRA